jgi:type IV pilus assembly protein PilW
MTKNLAKNKVIKQLGFTLIEVMIGLVIGLIAAIVIAQVFSSFEAKKRTTTGVADAQTNGSIALFNIQREVQSAGYGLPILDGDPNAVPGKNNSALLCAGLVKVDGDDNSATPDVDIFPINISTDARGSDIITVGYGSSEFGGLTTTLTQVVGKDLTVGSNISCDPGSIVLYVNGTTCSVGRMDKTGNKKYDKKKLRDDKTNISFTQNADPSIVTASTAKISCIGEFYEQIIFGVNAKNELTRSDRNGDVPIIADVVNLQAQYGISGTPFSNVVTAWVDAVTPANRNQVRAIRVAVIARSGKREKEVVSQTCSSLTAANPTGLCAWEGTISSAPNIDLATANPDWNHYRYRVYETIIPIRNLIFAGRVI